MKKVKTVGAFIIASGKEKYGVSSYSFHIFTKDEWSMGEGFRYPEWQCDSLAEAIEWITYP